MRIIAIALSCLGCTGSATSDGCADISGLYWKRFQHDFEFDGYRHMYVTQKGCNIQVLRGGGLYGTSVVDGSVHGMTISIDDVDGPDIKRSGQVLLNGDIRIDNDLMVELGDRLNHNQCVLQKGGGIWRKQECRNTGHFRDFWGNDCGHYATTRGSCDSHCFSSNCATRHCCACGGGVVHTTTTTTLAIKQAKCWAPTTCKSQTCKAYYNYQHDDQPPIPVVPNSEPLICGDPPLTECSGKILERYSNEDLIHEYCCKPETSNTCKDIVPPGQTKWQQAPTPLTERQTTGGMDCSTVFSESWARYKGGGMCDQTYRDGGYTSRQACCACGGGLSKDEPQPTTACVDKPGWKDEFGLTCAQLRGCSSSSSCLPFQSCPLPSTQACCSCGGGTHVNYSTISTTTTTWALCIEAKYCSMYACPDGYELKPESTTYCDDRLADKSDFEDEYHLSMFCHVADFYPWRSIRRCKLTMERCSNGICWDSDYEGFDDCCQRKQDVSTQCFGKPTPCSEHPHWPEPCQVGKVLRETASRYCNSSSDSPLPDCDSWGDFQDSCCHYEQKDPSLEVAEYNLQESAIGEQFVCDGLKFDECLSACAVRGESCTVVNYKSKLYVKARSTSTTTTLVQELCASPNIPCNTYPCPAGYSGTSNFVIGGPPFTRLCTARDDDIDGEVWSGDCYSRYAITRFNTCCELETPLSVGDCVLYGGSRSDTTCNCRCYGYYKVAKVLDDGISFKLECIADLWAEDIGDFLYCRVNGNTCPAEGSCSSDCAVNGCDCPVAIWDLTRSSKCGSQHKSLANPKHAEKGTPRGTKKERLAKSSLGQKRSWAEYVRSVEKKSSANKHTHEGVEAKRGWTSKERAMIEERDVARATPNKTRLLLSVISAGMVVSAVLVIKRRVQRSTVSLPESILG